MNQYRVDQIFNIYSSFSVDIRVNLMNLQYSLQAGPEKIAFKHG